jgi:hypothetical protein
VGLHGLAACKVQDGREALHVEAVANLPVLVGVHLTNRTAAGQLHLHAELARCLRSRPGEHRVCAGMQPMQAQGPPTLATTTRLDSLPSPEIFSPSLVNSGTIRLQCPVDNIVVIQAQLPLPCTLYAHEQEMQNARPTRSLAYRTTAHRTRPAHASCPNTQAVVTHGSRVMDFRVMMSG